ncbi:MAG: hypothetical protein HZC28_06450 [Spirochaetes bacterium]|nr:hypothetical protein [Spirochaetota bacterium]
MKTFKLLLVLCIVTGSLMAVDYEAIMSEGTRLARAQNYQAAIDEWSKIPEDSPLFEKAQKNITRARSKLDAERAAAATVTPPPPPPPPVFTAPKPEMKTAASTRPRITTKRVNVGVIAFTAESGVAASDAATINSMFNGELVLSKKFELLDRSQMDNMLKEAEFQQTGCTSSECAVQVGKMLNMQKMFFGTLSKLGNKYFILINLIDIESSKVDHYVKYRFDSLEESESAMKKIVAQFDEAIAEMMKAPEKVLTVEELGQRRDEAFGGVIRNSIIAGSLIAIGVGSWIGGDMMYNSGVNLYPSYKNAFASSEAEQLHDSIVSAGDLADTLYLVSESTLILSAVFLVWDAVDFFIYSSYAGQIQERKKAAMTTSFYFVPGRDTTKFGLTYRF